MSIHQEIVLNALDGQKAVAVVFVNLKAFWQVATFWALILGEVVDALLFTAA